MAKFMVLESNRRFLSSILRIDVEQTKNPWLKTADQFFTSIPVLAILFIQLILCAFSAFSLHSSSYDFAVKLTHFLAVIALCQVFTIFFNVGVYIEKTVDLYRMLQAIVDSEAENDRIQNIYWRAEQNYRKYSKIITVAVLVYDQSFYSIYWISTGNSDISNWPVLYEVSVPLDTKTIFGWYLQLLIPTCMDFTYFSCLLMTTTTFMGCCIYIAAICEHFASIMQTVQANVEQNRHERNPREFRETSAKINTQIHEAIEIHVQIHAISDSVADINSASIFALLPPNALVLGISMYKIHQGMIGGDLFGTAMYMIGLICMLLCPYLYCYFASLVIDRISNVQRSVYDSNWYDFPLELRKYLILIMAQSQRTVCIDGFGLVHCSLASFGMLVRSSISYYMAFQLISNRV